MTTKAPITKIRRLHNFKIGYLKLSRWFHDEYGSVQFFDRVMQSVVDPRFAVDIPLKLSSMKQEPKTSIRTRTLEIFFNMVHLDLVAADYLSDNVPISITSFEKFLAFIVERLLVFLTAIH